MEMKSTSGREFHPIYRYADVHCPHHSTSKKGIKPE